MKLIFLYIMWKSKLGHEYEKSYMEKNEKAFKNELNRLRKLPENRQCADCASEGTVWASVNLGVFLCLRCGSIHRGMGTHVSVPKGCTGTYLWGPDELASMRDIGNDRAREIYGGDEQRPPSNAGDDAWMKYIRDKYESKRFAPRHSPQSKLVHNETEKETDPVVVDTTEDLISFDYIDEVDDKNTKTTAPDFFSEFGL